MKRLGKIFILLAAAAGLLTLTALLCRHRIRRRRSSAIKLYEYGP